MVSMLPGCGPIEIEKYSIELLVEITTVNIIISTDMYDVQNERAHLS